MRSKKKPRLVVARPAGAKESAGNAMAISRPLFLDLKNCAAVGVHVDCEFPSRLGDVHVPNPLAFVIVKVRILHRATAHGVQGDLLGLLLADSAREAYVLLLYDLEDFTSMGIDIDVDVPSRLGDGDIPDPISLPLIPLGLDH